LTISSKLKRQGPEEGKEAALKIKEDCIDKAMGHSELKLDIQNGMKVIYCTGHYPIERTDSHTLSTPGWLRLSQSLYGSPLSLEKQINSG